jgi:hypothetical protein
MEKIGVSPKVALADTSYGGADNVNLAAERGIELVSPVPGKPLKEAAGAKPDEEEASEASGVEEPGASSQRFTLLDFEKNDGGQIIACPTGQKAKTIKPVKGGGFRSCFDCSVCKACPSKGSCPVKVGKFKASISCNEKQLMIAERRKQVETPEFKAKYRMRSGIEATNSLLKRRYGLKRLRVRGMKAVQMAVKFKALALSIGRAAAYEREKMKK